MNETLLSHKERRKLISDSEVTQVGPVDPALKTSEFTEVKNDSGDDRGTCYYNGAAYTPGAAICTGGRLSRCQGNGTWWLSGQHC